MYKRQLPHCENHFTGLAESAVFAGNIGNGFAMVGPKQTIAHGRRIRTPFARAVAEIRGSQLEKELHSSLHQPRRLCIYHLAERRTANVPVYRLRAKKLCVIESVEGLKPELQGF